MPVREAHPNFKATYQRADALGLIPVSTFPGVEHAGFDIDEVEKALGPERFQAFMAGTDYSSGVGQRPGPIQVFSCGHRNWPTDHTVPSRRGCEVHCVYAADLEQFLASEK